MFEDLSRKRNLIFLSVSIALVQIAGYYIASATLRADGTVAIAQPDTLLYCQAARRIAEGFPFSFSVGTAASTGTTSVLYPFLLTPFYMLGMKGTAFLTAGFVLNALFYILFIAGWCKVVGHVFAQHPMSRVFSSLMVAMFGPFAYCALAQSDIGLWMAASAWLAYGLLVADRRLYAPLLVLAPWIRPEGMVVVFACVVVFLGGLWVRRLARSRSDSIILIIAIASSIGVFALNYGLTGNFQFSSVSQKGYFSNLSFPSAVYATAIDAAKIVKAYVFGLPQDNPRDFFFVPILGAVLMWIGLLARSWRDVSWREMTWYLSMLGGVATVSLSGWQNTNMDRYLIWIMPVMLFYMVYGAEVVSTKCKSVSMCAILYTVLIVFSGGMSFVLMCIFRYSASGSDASRKFAARCEETMPAGASIGVIGSCGLAYEMSNRRVAHLSGIYSPEFAGMDSHAAKLEKLKNESKVRFDYWFCRVGEVGTFYCDKPDKVAGEAVLVAPPDLELRKANWSVYDAALKVPFAPEDGVSLRFKVDVAYNVDEKLCGYEVQTRDDYPEFKPLIRVGSLEGREILEGGRFILGGDSMTVPLDPGKNVHVVMRTALKCSATVWHEIGGRSSEFSLNSPMRLQILVDDIDAGVAEFVVKAGDFCDAHFMIPGKFIKSPNPRLTFLGEHVAFAYWFFQ